LTFSLANRALESSSNLRLSARGSLLLEHGADLKSPVLEIVDSTGTRHPLLRAKNARLVTSWWGLLSRNPQEIRVELEDPVVTLTRRGASGYLLPAFRSRTNAGTRPSPIAVDLDLRNATVLVVGGGAPGGHAGARARPGRPHARRRAHVGLRARPLRRDAARTRGCASRRPRAACAWPTTASRSIACACAPAPAGSRPRARDPADAALRHRGAASGRRVDVARPAPPCCGSPRSTCRAGRRHRGPAGAARHAHDLGADADVLWRDEPARARFEATWAKGQLSLHAARLDWRKTTFTGGFGLDTHEARWRLEGALDPLQLAELPLLWPMPKQETCCQRRPGPAGDRRGLAARVARGRGTWRDLCSSTRSRGRGRSREDADARCAGARGRRERRRAGHARPGARGGERARGARGRGAVPASWWRDMGMRPRRGDDREPGGPRRRPDRAAARDRDGDGHGFADGALVGRRRRARRSTARSAARGAGARRSPARRPCRLRACRLGLRGGDVLADPHRRQRFYAAARRVDAHGAGSAVRAGGGWDIHLDEVDWRAGERLSLTAEGPVELRWNEGGTLEVGRAHITSSAGALTAKGRWGGDNGASDLTLDLETLDLAALLGPIAADAGVQGVIHRTGAPRGPEQARGLDGQP
jgi:hypothetical protein